MDELNLTKEEIEKVKKDRKGKETSEINADLDEQYGNIYGNF